MSDWLVRLQDAVAGYPQWLVIGAGLVVLAGLCLLLAKVLRVVAVLILIAGVAAAGWLAWKAYGPDSQPSAGGQRTGHSAAAMTEFEHGRTLDGGET